MSKARKGIEVLRASWTVMRERRELMWLALAGSVAFVAVTAGVMLLEITTIGFNGLAGRFGFIIAIQIGAIPMTFTNFAVSAIADKHLRGERMEIGEAFAFTAKHSGQILKWSMLSAAVGLLLQAILERFKLGGWIASRLLGLAWALGTTFVIPVLVIEDVDVLEAVSRSAKTFKQQWGPSVTADAGIGVLMLFALIPIAIVCGLVAAMNLVAGVIVGAVAFFGLIAFFGVFGSIKNVALYRFAAEGVVVGNFTVDQMNSAFKPKAKKRFGLF